MSLEGIANHNICLDLKLSAVHFRSYGEGSYIPNGIFNLVVPYKDPEKE